MSPLRPPRPCAQPGCNAVQDATRCAQHTRVQHREKSRYRGKTAARGYDAQWRKVRAIKVARDPLCERCLELGRATPVALVHHIIPVRVDRGLRLTLGNLKSLCVQCHPIEEALSRGHEVGAHA